jgi:hypothetical protein
MKKMALERQARAAFAGDTDAGIDLASDVLKLVRRFDKACKR